MEMKYNNIEIFRLIDPKIILNTLDLINDATGLTAFMVEPGFDMIRTSKQGGTVPSICKLIKKHTMHKCNGCHKFLIDSSHESVYNKERIKTCPMGLSFVVSPVILRHGTTRGALFAGFVTLSAWDDVKIDRFQKILEKANICRDEIINELNKIKIVDREYLSYAADFLDIQSINIMKYYAIKNNKRTDYVEYELSLTKTIMGTVYDFFKNKENMQGDKAVTLEDEKAFVESISRGNMNKSQEILNEILSRLYYNYFDNKAYLNTKMIEIAVLICKAPMLNPNYSRSDILSLISTINQSNLMDMPFYDMKKWLFDTLEKVLERIKLENDRMYGGKIVKQAVQYINNNIFNELSAKDISRKVGLSHQYLNKLLKAETGMSIQEYVKSLKIEESKRMLANTDNTVTYIARELGFYDSAHFTREFKNLCGYTPVSYRKQMKERLETVSKTRYI